MWGKKVPDQEVSDSPARLWVYTRVGPRRSIIHRFFGLHCHALWIPFLDPTMKYYSCNFGFHCSSVFSVSNWGTFQEASDTEVPTIGVFFGRFGRVPVAFPVAFHGK